MDYVFFVGELWRKFGHDAGGGATVAFRLPDFIFLVLAGATMGSAFIPTFARYIAQRDEEEAWRLASSVLNLVALTTAVLVVIAVVLAPWIVEAMARRDITLYELYATTSSTGNFRSSRMLRISRPTLPVAPTTATL